MISSDYKKFIFFMLSTIALLLIGFLSMFLVLFYVLNNELGDIYWGVLLPIFAFFIMILFLVALVFYLASWIYFVKTKGYSRWLGLLGLIPIIGPIVLIFMKNKLSKEKEFFCATIFAFIGLIIPIIVFFSSQFILSSLKEEIEIINQERFTSTSKINAIIKGVSQERKTK